MTSYNKAPLQDDQQQEQKQSTTETIPPNTFFRPKNAPPLPLEDCEGVHVYYFDKEFEKHRSLQWYMNVHNVS